MIQVTQSPFLQALGFAIINSLWQFAVLWLVYMLVNSVLKLTSSQKYVTALALQFAGFAWFAGTLVFYYQQCFEMAEAIMALPADYSVDTVVGNSLKDRILATVLKGEQLLPYLSVAYLILLVILSVKTVQCYRRLQVIRAEGLQKINGEWRVFIQQLSLQLGIKRSVTIYLSNLVHSPVTLGFIKPLILLPLATVNSLTTEQIEAVLLHELAHIKRHDYFINLLLSVIEMTLFFNPFMQLISRDIKRERENSCDDWVLQYKYNATSYAKALLTIAKNRTKATELVMHATDDNRALLMRVKRMIEKKDRTFNYRQQLIALVLTTTLISSIAWLTSARNVRVQPLAENAQNVVVEPLAAKVDNPLFNPVFFLVKDEQRKTELQKPSVEINKTVVTVNHLPVKTLSVPERFSAAEAKAPGIKSAAEMKFDFFAEVEPDTLRLQLPKVVNKSIAAIDWNKIEQDIHKANKEIEASKWKLFLNSKEVKEHTRLAFEQLKKADVLNKQVTKIESLARQENKKAAELKQLEKSPRRIAILIETENLRKQLNELQEHQVTLANIPNEINFSVDIPEVVYSLAGRENRTLSSNQKSRSNDDPDNCNAREKTHSEAIKRRSITTEEKESCEANKTKSTCTKDSSVKKFKIVRI